jgi:hypothetical protein
MKRIVLTCIKHAPERPVFVPEVMFESSKEVDNNEWYQNFDQNFMEVCKLLIEVTIKTY